MYKFKKIKSEIKNKIIINLSIEDSEGCYMTELFLDYDKNWKMVLTEIISVIELDKYNTDGKEIKFKNTDVTIRYNPYSEINIDYITIYDENGESFYLEYKRMDELVNKF